MNKSKNIVSSLFIILSIYFIWVGYNRGEAQTVFQKAVHICLECIGIG